MPQPHIEHSSQAPRRSGAVDTTRIIVTAGLAQTVTEPRYLRFGLNCFFRVLCGLVGPSGAR
jgi:hypothetical protein